MRSVLVFVAFTVMVCLFSASSGVLREGYASLSKNIQYNDSGKHFSKGANRHKLIDAAQKLLSGLKKGTIDGKWLKAHGLSKDFLTGVDKQELIDTTQEVLDGLKNGTIDQQWILKAISGGSGYSGAFVLILVLFILLVIIGAGFGLG